MRKTASALVCATALALTGSVAAQSSPTPRPSQQTPSTTAGQQQRQGQTTPSTARQPVTLTGCVYEASDQPQMFALKGMNDTAGQSAATAGTQGASPNQQADAGNAANRPAQAAGTSGQFQNIEGAWFRLTPSSTESLKDFAGRRVRIMGTVTPGKDERGADIVIHRIQPDKTVITAIDLKPAPELAVTSVQAVSGSCAPAAQNRQQSPQQTPSPAQPQNPR